MPMPRVAKPEFSLDSHMHWGGGGGCNIYLTTTPPHMHWAEEPTFIPRALHWAKAGTN